MTVITTYQIISGQKVEILTTIQTHEASASLLQGELRRLAFRFANDDSE